MKKPKIKNNFIYLFFLLALFLRIYKLGIFPFGFHVDEVKVGWNALSILKTGKDDRGNKLALYYNSFGDYRPTGIFYLTIPSIAVFGKNEFAVRFPSALLGALTIFPLYLFCTELLKKGKVKNNKKYLPLTAAFLLAISPWHISVSRATSEVAISMFFALFGIYFFVKSLNQKSLKNAVISVVFILISYLFYHSIRLLAPMFIFTTSVYCFAEIKKSQILKKIALSTLGIISIFTFILALNKEARGRFSQVSIFNDLDVQDELTRMPFEAGPNRVFVARLFHNKVIVYSKRFINEYAKYFSADFFLNPETAKPERYTTVGIGILTYIELALFVLGLVAIAQKKTNLLPLLLLLIAPIPAALTTEDSPNLHRAFYMLPFISIIASYGFVFISEIKKYSKQIKYLSFIFLILNLVYYLHMYVVHNKVHKPLYRNIGAKELAIKINEIQKDYDKIILTNIPDDPYPWIAFFTGRNPKTFNQDAITRKEGTWTTENFVFTGIRCPSRDAFNKPDVKRLLVVDAEGCATESNLKGKPGITLTKITRPDETEVYNLWSMTGQ